MSQQLDSDNVTFYTPYHSPVRADRASSARYITVNKWMQPDSGLGWSSHQHHDLTLKGLIKPVSCHRSRHQHASRHYSSAKTNNVLKRSQFTAT
ncbi:hypothetical protein F2P81_018330 [Scophthalmus maximus]|uniref:Uncharacterized protein n=1 Tax=Scophthalmus maximus TaxID=52904 RepID=A0A6A4SA40_SCOMX|nr:hypothetical protein F2P81_018330 [Scophthalmus maximus]